MTFSCALDQWNVQSKHLIMVPYAYISNMETGLNVAENRNNKQKILYLKNCCVTLISAKLNNPEADVALVTNIDIPEPFAMCLKQADVAIITVPFDKFNFGEGYTWGLAFYKLCAQYYISHNTEYDAIACLDSDIYTQACFMPIWQASQSSVMLYRLGSRYENFRASRIYEEAEKFTKNKQDFVHYGGEFLVASSEKMRVISEKALEIFYKMQSANFCVTTGDEFITSVVANDLRYEIKLANKYIFRFWTGAYRSISPDYKTTLICLHVPAEKKTGMLRLYNYVCAGYLPPKEKVWSILHIPRRSLIESVKYIIKKILKS